MRQRRHDFWNHIDWLDVLLRFFTLFMVFVLLATICLLAYDLTGGYCASLAADSGYPHRYTLFNCQIEVEPGVWIPLENYRYQDNP